MTQWMDLQRTGKFVNPTQLFITCEKLGGLHLAKIRRPASSGTGSYSRQAGSPADEIWARLEILKA